MSDELDRLRSYIRSLPTGRPAQLRASRARLEDEFGHDVVRSRPRKDRRLLMGAGIATVLILAAVSLALVGSPPARHHMASADHITQPVLRLVSDDVNVTVASGSYDMTFNDTTTPSQCPQGGAGAGSQPGAGSQTSTCSTSSLPPSISSTSSFSSISGQGTVDTDPYGMVVVSQVGPLGKITLYDDGTDVWEIGGGDYGLAGPGQTGPGALLSGYAGSVEGTVGQQAGALDMQGLASGTGYLDLEASEIQGAQPAGTGIVGGVPVTIYKLSMTGLQDPDLNGLTREQVKTIRAADAVLEATGFSGKTTWVSVDADGYIRETRTTYTLSDGSTVDQDTILSNFGCAGTVLMPGASGSTAPPSGCVSPDTAGSRSTPTSTAPTSSTTTAPPSTTTTSTTSPLRTSVQALPPTGSAVLLLGNGIGNVHFGDTQTSATAALSDELGSAPTKSINEQGNCTIDHAEQWGNIVAYFDKGVFIGYSTLSANGEPLPDGNLVTAEGLRVGDTLASAQQLYGSELTTSFAQGGSWAAVTPQGGLEGFLSEEPDQSSPAPTILSIEAGAVGCPAMTP
jgi:hypothetical protein